MPDLSDLAQSDAPVGNPDPSLRVDMGDIRAHDLALGHLNARGFIQYHPVLAQRLDSFKAAIFLGHALYWSRYLAHAQPHRRGWFFMTAAQWREATGLSTHEQTIVREDLTRRGLMEEALAGRPAVLHYRINLQATAQLLGVQGLTWETLKELLRSSISFYKPLADICGSVSAGLYLSYLLQRQSFALRNPVSETRAVELFPGEFSYRPEQARIALCLGIKAQRNAREKLKAAGFIREGRATQDVVATRVNLSAIASCLQAQDKPARKRKSRQAATALALTPAPQPRATAAKVKAPNHPGAKAGAKGGAAITGLSRQLLPQRQLHLFTPLGLATANANGADPTVARPKAAPATDAARLVKSLFAPTLAASTPNTQEAAPTVPTTPSLALETPTAAASKLSTGALKGPNEFALFENPICPFLEPNLPFFRNYIKEQRFYNSSTTTTSTPSAVDNSASGLSGRRRVEIQVNQKSGSLCSSEIDSKASNQAAGRDSFVSQWGDGHEGEKSLQGPDVEPPDLGAEQALNLVLPSQLDASVHAAVLATVATAPSELQQSFLDELAGHLSIPGKVIHNAAGWLHGLIRNHREGLVVLAMAPQVAALRERKQRHQQRLVDAETAAENAVAARTSPQPSSEAAPESETQREHRQRLLALRNALASKRGGVA